MSVNPKLIAVFEEQVDGLGLGARLAEVHAAESSVLSLMRDPDQALDVLARLVRETHARTGATSVIIGGAPLAGQAVALSRATGVTVLDGVACAVSLIEAMVRLEVPSHASGVESKSSTGLSPNLGALFAAGGHRRQETKNGERG